jgi:glycosyltransferase involved in cell wall biosynthesis
VTTTAAEPTAASAAVTPDRRRVRLAYLTTQYPKVSHTFIRREIRALEERGHSILRLAIRAGGDALADPADEQEAERTVVCLRQPAGRFLAALAAALVRHPLGLIRAVAETMALSRRSDRGLARHVAYLLEAALLARLTRRRDIEHLHVHFGTNAAAVAMLMRHLGGPPYSLTIHGPDEFDAPIGFSLDRKVCAARFVAVISDYAGAQLRRWVPSEQWSKLHVVRCGIGAPFRASPPPIEATSATLLCIGRLAPQKGQLLLLDALAALRRERPDARLVLAGDGPMRETIERRIRDRGLESAVRITGWIGEAAVRDELSHCRGLVQPSFAEGLPVVMMEALATGRPVVATTIAGVPELVRDGENGWLVTAGSVDELVEAMRELLDTPAPQLDEMGQRGRQLVWRRHDSEQEAARLGELFVRYADSSAIASGGRG